MEDLVTGHSFECGATGVTEALQFIQPDLTYDPSIVHGKSHNMDVYFQERPGCSFFDKLIEWMPQIKWEITEEEEKDWLAEWKKDFKPFQIVGPFWIVPSWCEVPKEATHPIYIDPGMAFGTGTHATTKMAAYFIHKMSPAVQRGQSLLDVGTGTGVLAMMAKIQGIDKVVALEIDPEARRVARENCQRNNLESIQIPDTPLEEVKESFDFVVANIIDGVLVQIKNDLLRVLKPQGQLFLTGILTERDDYFFSKFIDDSHLKVLRRLEKDEWVGYWLQKVSP